MLQGADSLESAYNLKAGWARALMCICLGERAFFFFLCVCVCFCCACHLKNLAQGNWLGNGKWGWVMMAPKKGSDKQAEVCMPALLVMPSP